MSPARLKSFPLDAVEAALRDFGIHILEKFDDGQVRWGDRPLPQGGKFKGRSMMSSPYGWGEEDRNVFDILTTGG